MKKKKKENDYSGVNDRRADRKTEVKGGQIHTMSMSLVDVKSRIDLSDLGEE